MLLLILLLSPCQERDNARAGDASVINDKNVMLSKNREEAHHQKIFMLQFGRDYYPPDRRGKEEEEKEW